MDASALIPSPDTIPAPWGWFKVLLLVTFTIHLLLMNLVLGGSLLAFARHLRGRSLPAQGKSIPILIALTINFGVPPLLFVQVLFGQFFYSSSILMAVFWISVIPILILAYYAAYGWSGRLGRPGFFTRLWLGASSLLLLAVAFFYSNNMTLMLRPERWTAYFARPGGTFLNAGEPTLFPRYLHFVTAAVAIAGLGSAVWGRLRARRNGRGAAGTTAADALASPSERWGLRVFAWATSVQIAVGILFLFALPSPIRQQFLGGSPLPTAVLWTGVMAAVAAVGLAFHDRLWPAAAIALGAIACMVLARDMLRTAYLAPYFHPRDLVVAPQTGPLLVFLGAFLLVALVLVWMARAAWRPAPAAPQPRPGSEG